MATADKDSLRADRAALLAALAEAGADVSKPSAIRCPFHDDQHPSAGVYQRDDGAWAFKCLGCGVNYDIIDVKAHNSDTTPADVLRGMQTPNDPPAKPKRTWPSLEAVVAKVPGKVEAVYRYTCPKTKGVEMAVIRWHDGDRKRFWQASPRVGGWVLESPKGPLPLYNRARVKGADEVVVVEGEKCVHALHELGIVATTSPGGAKAWGKADWKPLAGKVVVLWPDNDANGHEYAEGVRSVLEKLEPPVTVRVVDIDKLDLQEKGDAADFIERCGAEAGVRVPVVLAAASSMGASAGVAQRIEDTIAGKRYAVEWPWPIVNVATKALLPGTVTLICGQGGSSKSFFLLQAAMHWHGNGAKCAVYQLEDDQAYHLHRAMAMLIKDSRLTDDEWVRDNPEHVRTLFESNRHLLDDFGRVLYDAPPEGVTLDGLANWVEARAAEGCRVVAIDPVTAAEPTEKPWVADRKFLQRVERSMVDHQASLVLVTHPKSGAGKQKHLTLDDLAGGQAYPRFAKTVLGMDVHNPSRQVTTRHHGKRGTVSINRSIRILKARNGRGTGWEMAFYFDGADLSFKDHGVVIEDAE